MKSMGARLAGGVQGDTSNGQHRNDRRVLASATNTAPASYPPPPRSVDIVSDVGSYGGRRVFVGDTYPL